MKRVHTLPESGRNKQLSNKALQEMIRSHAREAIDTLVWLLQHADNHNARLGAAKVLLAKIIPDLRQIDGNMNVNLMKILLDLGNEHNQTQPVTQLSSETKPSVPDAIDPTV